MPSEPPPRQPTRTEFSGQLSAFDTEVQDFLTVVTVTLRRATDALLAGDQTEADRMAEGAALSRSILADVEQDLEVAFARQAPVGRDLRLMLTVLHVVPPLERCIGLARHIAERAHFAPQLTPEVLTALAEMGTLTIAMWERTSTAWRHRDPNAATAIDTDDDKLDVLSTEITEQLEQHQLDLTVAVQARLIVRFYERLGDHAVHIAERIAYLATEHKPPPT